MPLVLLILRLLTGFGAVFRLGASGTRWFRKRGTTVGPKLRPKFAWRLDGGDTPAQLRFRLKNDGQKSAIIDQLRFSIELEGTAQEAIALPASIADSYPIQVKPDESSGWYALSLEPRHVELMRTRERLAKVRAAGAESAARQAAESGDEQDEQAAAAAARPLESGVQLVVVHEHGTHEFAVPGPWATGSKQLEQPGDSEFEETATDEVGFAAEVDGMGLS